MPRGLRLARLGATLLVAISVLPLLGAVGIVLVVVAWLLGLRFWPGRLWRPWDNDEDRGRATGEALTIVDPAGRRTTALVPGYVIGQAVTEGDRVTIRFRQTSRGRILRRGSNLSQGGGAFRGRGAPWPWVLAAMLAWIALRLAWAVHVGLLHAGRLG